MSIESQSFLPLIARMFDAALTNGKGYEQLIDLLSLLCLITIVTRPQGQMGVTPTFASGTAPATANPTPAAAPESNNSLQNTLAELLKNVNSGGNSNGTGADTLMSLLPLLNNPQIKSKMNPTNMAAIMSLLGNMGSGNPDSKKSDAPAPQQPPEASAPPAATSNQTSPPFDSPSEESDSPSSRYLNWKTNF
jgi:hypothetical protein